jgi:hypothetical protein
MTEAMAVVAVIGVIILLFRTSSLKNEVKELKAKAGFGEDFIVHLSEHALSFVRRVGTGPKDDPPSSKAACGGPHDLLSEVTDAPTCPRCLELTAAAKVAP